MILDVAWSGPKPAVGDWLAARQAAWAWEITAVELRVPLGLEDGRSLRLKLVRRRMDRKPDDALLFPWTKVSEIDPHGPPVIRQLARTGSTAVMADAWTDPDDVRPNASHRPRQVKAYRSLCWLRRYRARPGTYLITLAHISAAERLRRDWDNGRAGFSGPDNPLMLGNRGAPGPRSGPSKAAVAQAHASSAFNGAMRLFTDPEQALIIAVVLEHVSLDAWSKEQSAHGGRRVDEKTELGRLVTHLDHLVAYYGEDLRHDEEEDRVLLPRAATN